MTTKNDGPFKSILATIQGDLIDYTHARSFKSARNWLGAIGQNAVGVILDRKGNVVWESKKLDDDGSIIKRNPVKANPITEARELWLYARNLPQFVNAARDAFQNNATAKQWQSIALKAARDYSAQFGHGSSRWRDIFTDDDLLVVASMLRDDMQNEAEDDAQYRKNPTPRLTRYDQPSQRERISPRTGRPTKTPSARLKNRRVKTHYQKMPGIWANPLTRVKIKSPAQRGGADPSSRLVKRRKVTAKAPEGLYANPVAKNQDRYAVQRQKGSRWDTLELFDNREFALIFARAYAKAHPSATIRVWDYGT